MQQYNIHQLRYLSNAVLHALSTRPLTDTRPDNPDHRFRITASPVHKAGPGNSIPETKRMLAISPAHTGLELPLTGILIRQSQLDEWVRRTPIHRQVSLHRAVEQARKAKINGHRAPNLWEAVWNQANGWVCYSNPVLSNNVRIACLELLNTAFDAGNVKPVGSDAPA